MASGVVDRLQAKSMSTLVSAGQMHVSIASTEVPACPPQCAAKCANARSIGHVSFTSIRASERFWLVDMVDTVCSLRYSFLSQPISSSFAHSLRRSRATLLSRCAGNEVCRHRSTIGQQLPRDWSE